MQAFSYKVRAQLKYSMPFNNVYLHILENICKIAGNVGCRVIKILTASGALLQPLPLIFGVGLPLTSSKGSAPWSRSARTQNRNPPFQNPVSTAMQQELVTQWQVHTPRQ